MTFKQLSEYFQQLEQTSARLKITEILADLFKKARVEEIDKIVYLSLGRLLPPYEGLEFQMADKMMVRAIAKAFGVEEKEVLRQYKQIGDLGTVGEELRKKSRGGKMQSGLFEKQEKSHQELTITQVYERLLAIAQEAGAGSVERKIDKMAVLLEDLGSLSVRYTVRIPLGKLRLGFSDLTVLDALSWMEKKDKSLRPGLEAAFNVLADLGKIAQVFKKKGLKGLKEIKVEVGTPVLAALAQRLGTVEEMLEKMGKVVVEPKYDGTRLQLHLRRKGKDLETKVFTRNLENVTHMFPDVAEALVKEVRAESAILDAEGVGVDPRSGHFLPFQKTIKRKRKHGVVEVAKEIPFKVFVFDILYKDGKSLIEKPLIERRKVLEACLGKKPGHILIVSPQIVTDKAEEIREYHDQQIAKGLEGAMVKKADAPYEAGRRGFTWVKFKQEETKKGGGLADTVEAVVMGTYRGKGKRAKFGVGAFLVGVKKGEKFLTVSKIGTGLTDEQWQEIYKRTQKKELRVQKQPPEYDVNKNLVPDTWVKPEIVVEIQADNITQSPIHTAGLALRFPRLIRFRDDKPVGQITTSEELLHLYKLQFGRSKK